MADTTAAHQPRTPRYRNIRAAIALLEIDQGCLCPVQLSDCEGLSIRDERFDGDIDLARADEFLAGLGAGQLELFVLGDRDDAAALFITPEGRMTDAFLEFLFGQMGRGCTLPFRGDHR